MAEQTLYAIYETYLPSGVTSPFLLSRFSLGMRKLSNDTKLRKRMFSEIPSLGKWLVNKLTHWPHCYIQSSTPCLPQTRPDEALVSGDLGSGSQTCGRHGTGHQGYTTGQIGWREWQPFPCYLPRTSLLQCQKYGG